MAFDWLNKFVHRTEKAPGYAEKTLAAYRLGMRGKGSIVGVIVEPGPDCCSMARDLPAGKVYDPDGAPILPLPGCPLGGQCNCIYRPAMTYQHAEKP